MRRSVILAVLAAILLGSVASARAAEDTTAGRTHVAVAAWFFPHGKLYRGYLAVAAQDDDLAPAAGTSGSAVLLAGLCKLKEREGGFLAICGVEDFKRAALTGAELSIDPTLSSARLQIGEHWVTWTSNDMAQPADSQASHQGTTETAVYLVHSADIEGRLFGRRLHPGQGKEFAWFASGMRAITPDLGLTRRGIRLRVSIHSSAISG
jgi:hypothetical protein